MSFVFWQHPAVVALFLLTAVSAIPAARFKRFAFGAGCMICTATMILASLTCAVPYEEILLLLLIVLLLFFALSREGKP